MCLCLQLTFLRHLGYVASRGLLVACGSAGQRNVRQSTAQVEYLLTFCRIRSFSSSGKGSGCWKTLSRGCPKNLVWMSFAQTTKCGCPDHSLWWSPDSLVWPGDPLPLAHETFVYCGDASCNRSRHLRRMDVDEETKYEHYFVVESTWLQPLSAIDQRLRLCVFAQS